MPTASFPDVPKEQAPTHPNPSCHKDTVNLVKPLPVESVQSLEVITKGAPIPSELSSPVGKTQLSMETEVPPAINLVPCDPAQIKVPIPECCVEGDSRQSYEWSNYKTSDNNYSDRSSWKENEVHEKTANSEVFADPGEPVKLDDFIKSLMPPACKSENDHVVQENMENTAEQPMDEELYQVPIRQTWLV